MKHRKEKGKKAHLTQYELKRVRIDREYKNRHKQEILLNVLYYSGLY